MIREGQLQRFLRYMKDKNIFTKENYEKIYPSGSKPAFIYGTPKIHKLKHNNVNELSLCPIISSIGTTIIILLSFSLLFLKLQFLQRIAPKIHLAFARKSKRASNKFLVSYDACSLFTSIPLTKTIDITVDLLFEKKHRF